MLPPSCLRTMSIPIYASRTLLAKYRFPLRAYSVKAKSYYDVLEISPKANNHQIKAAYYRLSKKYHPDVNNSSGAKAAFSSISEAYDVLGNKQRKRLYDQGMFNPQTIHGTGDPVDTTYEEFLKRTGQFRPKKGTATGKTKFYDFDEFYRQHYGQSMNEKRQHEADKAAHEKDFVESENEKKRNLGLYVLFLGVIFLNFFRFTRKKKF